MIGQSFFLDNKCVASCPNSSFSDSVNQCNLCQNPCQTCEGAVNNCTSCISGYELTDGKCKNTSLFFTRYYFFFSGAAVVLSILVLLIKACACETKWVDGTIALISIPEIGGWAFLLFLYVMYTTYFHILILAAAVGVHVILNVAYGITHQKMIIHQSGETYKTLILDYHCWNTFSIVISFVLSFKFHLIQMSHFGGNLALSGDWPNEVWGLWNMMSITYIISCYLILMGSSVYFVVMNMDRMEEWIWNMSIDIAGISTYMTFLLLISSC